MKYLHAPRGRSAGIYFTKHMNAPQKVLSVRRKILITIIGSIVVLGICISVIASVVLMKSYRDLENAAMAQDLRRANDAITEFSGQQRIKLSDWAAWDEAYEYARDRDPVWAADTIYATGLANLDINMMLFADITGAPIRLMAVDIPRRTEVSSTDMQEYFAAHEELITFDSLLDVTEGIAMLPDGPLIVVSLPLRTSEGKGPSTGSLTFARYLDSAKVDDFSDITHLNLSVYEYKSDSLPSDVREAKARLSAGSPNVIEPKSSDLIAGYAAIKDVYGEPALILKVETPRPIYAQGTLTLGVYLILGAGALLLFAIIMIWALDKLVIGRFERLAKDVEKINDAHDVSLHLSAGEPDEIGRFAATINQMLAWLAESREGEAASRREIVNLLDELKKGKQQADEMAAILAKKETLG